MTDLIKAARLDAIKTICRREGHNWSEITTYGHRLRDDVCARGCGARRHRLHPGQKLTPAELAALLPADGTAMVTDVEVVVEPEEH